MNYLEESIQEWSSEICATQSLKILTKYPIKFFKDCLLQILLGPFLNSLSHLCLSLHMYIHKKSEVNLIDRDVFDRVLRTFFFFIKKHMTFPSFP